MTQRNAALSWISLVAVYLIWGSTYLGIRVAVTTIPPYLMTGVRYVIAGGLLLAIQWFAAKEKPPLPSRRSLVPIVVTAVLLIVVGNGMLCVVETRVESGTSALLIATTPIWMLLIDAFLARKMPALPAIVGVALGTAGIATLVGRGSGHVNLLFASLLILGSISWAAGSIYARGKDHGPLTASLEMLAGGAISLLVAVALGQASHLNVAAIAPASLWGMLWLITAGAMVAYSAFAYAVRTLPTATVATYAYVNPVVAVILGALILREPVTWNVLLGGAAVVASVIVILLGNRLTAEELTASG
ncbi:MAG TPA: EamA family transporter [Candidatus Nitrosotalea sp.]|nr:EamA family transporter [Candidatus Nitrosotalea sp.]